MTPETITALRKLAESGAPPAQIVRQLGVSKGAVAGWLFRNLRCRPAPPPTPPTPSAPERPDFPTSGHCLWINGDPRTTNFAFCAKPTGESLDPWCPTHRKRVYVREREAQA